MNRAALITGGLGLEFARIFARAEYNLVLVVRSQDKLEAVADAYPDTEMKWIVKDLVQPGAALEVADEVHHSAFI